MPVFAVTYYGKMEKNMYDEKIRQNRKVMLNFRAFYTIFIRAESDVFRDDALYKLGSRPLVKCEYQKIYIFSYFSTITHVVGTQKNHLNTKNICFN